MPLYRSSAVPTPVRMSVIRGDVDADQTLEGDTASAFVITYDNVIDPMGDGHLNGTTGIWTAPRAAIVRVDADFGLRDNTGDNNDDTLGLGFLKNGAGSGQGVNINPRAMIDGTGIEMTVSGTALFQVGIGETIAVNINSLNPTGDNDDTSIQVVNGGVIFQEVALL